MNTVNKKEVEKFSKLAKEWWDPFGKFKPLHKFNPVRVEYIRNELISHFHLDDKSSEPLKKLNILDIGCGGGLLSEPVARMGANVVGVDASLENIEVAKLHSKKMSLDIEYFNGNLENISFKKKFDVILNMEVIEHVANPQIFIKKCSDNLKSNGLMFTATLNRTLKSYLLAIVGAEYILRWLPIGTHDWNYFFKPEELNKIAQNSGLKKRNLIGVKFNPINGKWTKSSDVSVNYIYTFIKN